jgi:hypothetical protein
MKRKVRIYKDPNGQGGYINKTAQWLRKAQEGAQMMSPVTAGIMQQMQPGQQQMMQQQTPQQDQGDMMLQQTTEMISRGMDKEQIKATLLSQYSNFDEGSPEYSEAEAQVDQYIESVYDQLGENAAEETNQELGQDREEYQDPADYLGEAEQATEPNYYYDLAEGDDESADADIEEDYSFGNLKYGGVPNKRSFINKTVRQLKKAQQGGDQVEQANTANVRGTENNPTTDSPGNKNIFVAGVKDQAADHFFKQQAEQMYNNQFGQGMPQPGMMQPQDDMDYAQFGGWRMRRANRAAFGTPFIPPGASAKYKFGFLGGLRNAEIQFSPLMAASMFPMMGGFSSWGYNQPYKKTTKGRLVTEKIATVVNNKSTEDVAKATNSDAATTSADQKEEVVVKENKDGTVTTEKEETNVQNVPSEVNGARQAMELRNKKDRWGRSPDNKWYGFDPVVKAWTLGVPEWAKKEQETNVSPTRWSNVTEKKDKWGRLETDKFYGFDPKTKKWTLGEPDWLVNKTGRESLDSYYNSNKPQKKAPEDNTGSWSTKGSGAGVDTGNPKLVAKAKKTPEYKKFVKERVTQKKPLGMSDAQWKKLQSQYKQFGGGINNPQQDQFGNLQRFIYGGDEDYSEQMLQDLYQPQINQSDLDYSDSKDTTDAFFRNGGLYRFDGNADSQTNPTNAPKTYTQEELDKMLAEKQKSWETDYQKKYNQQMQGQQQMMQGYPGGYGAAGYNPYDSYSAWSSRGNYGGFGPYASTGLLGAAGNLIKGFGRGPSTYGPAGNPLQYAATAAAITNSGMLPTGMRYSKEKGSGLLGKLGLKNDKVWTLDYATPDQIKAGAIPGAAGANAQPGATPGTNQDTSKMSRIDKRIAKWDERSNRGIPAEADAYQFTGTLTGSTGEDRSKGADEELANFQANQRKQGLVFDPKTQKWVKGDSPLNNIMTSSTPGISPSQGANIVTGTPGISVGTLPSQGTVSPNTGSPTASPSGVAPGTAISGMTESPGMVGKSDAEIREALIKGTSIPTVVNKGNTTYINAAGNPINPADYENEEEYAYGGYIPSYMAYGGYLPTADNGINFSTVSYEGNPVIGVEESPTWGAMQYFNQNQNIKNPDADKFKNYTIEPEGEDLTDCTYEQKLDPTSKCYEPQTAQLKIKEEKGKIDATKAARGILDFGANLADAQDYATERRNKYIPGMTEFAMGEKQTANEVINKGEWNARTGKEGIQGFEGVIRKGGAIKSKKSKASGHKINISDFQDLMRLAGLK